MLSVVKALVTDCVDKLLNAVARPVHKILQLCHNDVSSTREIAKQRK